MEPTGTGSRRTTSSPAGQTPDDASLRHARRSAPDRPAQRPRDGEEVRRDDGAGLGADERRPRRAGPPGSRVQVDETSMPAQHRRTPSPVARSAGCRCTRTAAGRCSSRQSWTSRRAIHSLPAPPTPPDHRCRPSTSEQPLWRCCSCLVPRRWPWPGGTGSCCRRSATVGSSEGDSDARCFGMIRLQGCRRSSKATAGHQTATKADLHLRNSV